jgi:hypothetical protein
MKISVRVNTGNSSVNDVNKNWNMNLSRRIIDTLINLVITGEKRFFIMGRIELQTHYSALCYIFRLLLGSSGISIDHGEFGGEGSFRNQRRLVIFLTYEPTKRIDC